jgi:hypothetical protein
MRINRANDIIAIIPQWSVPGAAALRSMERERQNAFISRVNSSYCGVRYGRNVY